MVARESWGKLGLEFASIVVGIFLALVANDWYQGKLDRDLGREALFYIRSEIAENRKEIEQKMPRIKAIQSLLQSYPEEGQMSVTQIIREMNVKLGHGFDMPLLKRSAWESAQSTGAAKHIKYAIVRELAVMATLEDLVEKRNDRLLSLVYNPDITDPTKVRGLITTAKMLGGDNIGTLNDLLKIYEKNIKLLDKELD